jgi:predicted dehydrogenase
LRGAVIGAGGIVARLRHIPAFLEAQKLGLAEIVAICDPVPGALDAAGEQFGITDRYLDFRDVLARDDIDVVTIATPDHLHRQICEDAALAGKHFLVEKPLTTSLDEADELIATVRASGVKAMTSFNHRWIPAYANAFDQISAGRIGSPVMAYARKNDRIYVPTEMLSWAAETTPAWFLSSHDIDLICWFMGGVPTEVVATGVKRKLVGLGIDTYDAIQAQIRFDDGSIATVESCWIYPNSYPSMTDSFIEVVGSDGVIHLDRRAEGIDLSTDQAYEWPRMAIMPTIHGRQRGAMADAVNHVIDCVADDLEPLVTLESSRQVTAVLDALHRSLDSGVWEALR